MKRFISSPIILPTVLVLLLAACVIAYTGSVEAWEPIVIEVTKPTETHATSTTPADPDVHASSFTYSDPITIEEDVVISRIETTMGNAPLETLHHLLVYALDKTDAVCGHSTNAAIDEIYAMSRNNPDVIEFPEPYGIHLPAGTVLQVEFMEHTRHEPHGPGGHYDDHTLRVTLHTADPDRRPVPLEFIRPRLDDTPCTQPITHQAFTVPVGEEPFTRTANGPDDGRYLIKHDGVMLTRGANVWPDKGGESVRVYRNDIEIDRFIPLTQSEPWRFLIPYHHDPIPVSAGDMLTIDATYTNPFPTPIKDASGIFGFYFAPNASLPDTSEYASH